MLSLTSHKRFSGLLICVQFNNNIHKAFREHCHVLLQFLVDSGRFLMVFSKSNRKPLYFRLAVPQIVYSVLSSMHLYGAVRTTVPFLSRAMDLFTTIQVPKLWRCSTHLYKICCVPELWACSYKVVTFIKFFPSNLLNGCSMFSSG